MLSLRNVLMALLLAAAALWGGTLLVSADGEKKDDKKEQPPPKCDLAHLETVPYCPECHTRVENSKCGCGKSKECQCKEKKTELQLCVKTYYECVECHHKQIKAGKCTECKKGKVEEKKSKTEVVYHCDTDDVTSEKPGKCEKCKKNLAKTCKESGHFPHGGTP
ncbi:MAG: hypothetical protein HYZ53_17365 [Planctomycetes bacterium]|nr:hypothetical protein [Planctomycetota bacterium]